MAARARRGRSRHQQQQVEQQAAPSQQDDAKSYLPTMKQRVLQFLSVVGVVQQRKLFELMENEFGITKPKAGDLLNSISADLAAVNLVIHQVRYELDGELYVGLTNAFKDDLSVTATPYTKEQIAYFKNILHYLIDNDGEMSKEKAMGLGQVVTTRKVTLRQQEMCVLLIQFTQCGWLRYDTDSQTFCCGPRTFLDLDHYLEDKVESECVLCQESLLKGFPCPLDKCSAKYHEHCVQQLVEKPQTRKCLSCTRPWPEDILKKKGKDMDEDMEEEEEEDEEE